MPKVKITSSMNHVVYCENEHELFDTMQAFEEYLMKEGMKPFVKIGAVYQENHSFDFRITTDEAEEKEIIYQFFKISEPVAHTNYRILVHKGREAYYYPFNDLKTALLVFKVIEKEVEPNTEINLVRHYPHAKGEWIIWKDRQGRTAKEIQLQLHNGELIVDLFSTKS